MALLWSLRLGTSWGGSTSWNGSRGTTRLRPRVFCEWHRRAEVSLAVALPTPWSPELGGLRQEIGRALLPFSLWASAGNGVELPTWYWLPPSELSQLPASNSLSS